jgi:hypothetical protein
MRPAGGTASGVGDVTKLPAEASPKVVAGKA